MNEPLEQTRVEPLRRHGMVALDSQGEARLNRLLRRVDWRFLTGNPHPRLSLVSGTPMLAEALKLVSQEVVALQQAAPGSADLAAVINPGVEELELAWKSLEPGGVLYGEWYRPRPGGPGALHRRLAALGFLPAGSYWPWPWPERAAPAFWLPLESSSALRYFLNNRPPAPSRLTQALRRGLQLAWRSGRRAGLLAPVCLVAYKPVEINEGGLAARATGWGLARDGASLDWLLLTGGLHSTNKVTGLVFTQDAYAPSFVVKMPRRHLSLPSIRREAEALQEVHSRKGKSLTGIPSLVHVDASPDGFPAIVETYLPGAPLYTVMRPDRLGELALQAARWLVNLVAPGPGLPPSAWWDRLVAPVLDEFERGFAAAGGRPILDALQIELTHLGSMPLAIEHRDFSPWNVFIAPDGSLAVLDWEGAEPQGLPFSDLVYFLTYLTFFAEDALDSRTTKSSYQRMLDPRSQLGSIASVAIREYCSAVKLPAESLRPLRLLTWLRHAVLERSLISTSSGEPDPHLLRDGLYLSLLRTELELQTGG